MRGIIMAEKKISTEEIYNVLKRKIVELEYEPGQVLNEADVADEFGVSRTPIRKVFQLLETDKLLNIVPRFGAQVVPIDFIQMKQIFELTRILDPFATKLACSKIDDESIKELEEILERMKTYDITNDYQNAINDDERFHQIIYDSCGNIWLQDILSDLHNHTERLWHYSQDYFDDMNLFIETLSRVIEGIKEKDVDKAMENTRIHIDDFVEKIRDVIL